MLSNIFQQSQNFHRWSKCSPLWSPPSSHAGSPTTPTLSTLTTTQRWNCLSYLIIQLCLSSCLSYCLSSTTFIILVPLPLCLLLSQPGGGAVFPPIWLFINRIAFQSLVMSCCHCVCHFHIFATTNVNASFFILSKFSDVVESWVRFASKTLTPRRMH